MPLKPFISTAATWVATRGPTALGVGRQASRAHRILRPEYAQSRPSPDGADTFGCDIELLPRPPEIVEAVSPYTGQWRWANGPGGQPPSGLVPSPEGARAAGVPLYPKYPGPWPERTVPSLSAVSGGYTPAAVTRQEAPFGKGLPPSSSALLAPSRSVEPWTTEEWVLAYDLPGSFSEMKGGPMLISSYGRWWGDANSGEEASPWMPIPSGATPYKRDTYPWVYERQAHTTEASIGWQLLQTYQRAAVTTIGLTRCPIATLSAQCTPDGIPIAPNDTCRQAIAWQQPPLGVDPQDCALRPNRPDLAHLTSFPGDDQVAANNMVIGTAVAEPAAPGTRQFPFDSGGGGLYNRWHQVLTVVYPPGTVAELPLEKVGDQTHRKWDAQRAAEGAAGQAYDKMIGNETVYPWRVNPRHVIQVVWSVPGVAEVVLAADAARNHSTGEPWVDNSGGSVKCFALEVASGDNGPLGTPSGFPGIQAMQVLLDDPGCVQARNCSPALPAGAAPGSPEYLHAVADWVIEYQQSSLLGMRVPRFACSVAYHVNYTLLPLHGMQNQSVNKADDGHGVHEDTIAAKLHHDALGSVSTSSSAQPSIVPLNRTVEWTVDVVHLDYPAAASTRAATIGGYLCQCAMQNGPGAYPNTTVTAKPLGPEGPGSPWNGPWNYPPKEGEPWEVVTPIPVYGPKARYRGAALWRVTAPSPEDSLPSIYGGLWECGETSPIGAYFMRPVCRATCDDPNQIAVDIGLEHGAADAAGWELVASLARPWLSRWGGHPALIQSSGSVPRSNMQPAGFRGTFRGWGDLGTWQPSHYDVSPYSSARASGNDFSAAIPSMECRHDAGKDKGWSSRWAQREPTSHAELFFTLYFDRSYWPPAHPRTLYGSMGPGLSYPSPNALYILRLAAEIYADVMDILGEWDPSKKEKAPRRQQTPAESFGESPADVREIVVEVLDVRSPPPPRSTHGDRRPLSPGIPYEPPYLPMEIDVQVLIPPLPSVQFGVNGTNSRRSYRGKTQRGRSAGALAQQLGFVLLGKRPGAEGGVWLPAAVPSSLRLSVFLPCLDGRSSNSAAGCGVGWFQSLQSISATASLALLLVMLVSSVALRLAYMSYANAARAQYIQGVGTLSAALLPPDYETPAGTMESHVGGQVVCLSAGRGIEYETGQLQPRILRRYSSVDTATESEQSGCCYCWFSYRTTAYGVGQILGTVFSTYRSLTLWILAASLAYTRFDLPAVTLFGALIVSMGVRICIISLEGDFWYSADASADSRIASSNQEDRETPLLRMVCGDVLGAALRYRLHWLKGKEMYGRRATVRPDRAGTTGTFVRRDGSNLVLSSVSSISSVPSVGLPPSTSARSSDTRTAQSSHATHVESTTLVDPHGHESAPDVALSADTAGEQQLIAALNQSRGGFLLAVDAGTIGKAVEKSFGTVLVVRLLQVLAWDAQRLLWSGISSSTDPLRAEQSSAKQALRSRLEAAVWRWSCLFRAVEDLAVLGCCAWAAACAVGLCERDACLLEGIFGSRLMELTSPILYFDERATKAGLAVTIALACVLASLVHTIASVLSAAPCRC